MKFANGRGKERFVDVYFSAPFAFGAVLLGASLIFPMRALVVLPLAVFVYSWTEQRFQNRYGDRSF
jgi:hypothetical protein